MKTKVKDGSSRLPGIDAVAGIMILNMVVVHCHTIPIQIYLSFFMPWFFYKSGMFYKHQSTVDCIKNSARKLLYPFVVFTIIGSLIHFFIIMLEGDRNWIHYTLTPLKEIILAGTTFGNQPLWFLLSLFLVKVLFSFVENHTKYPVFIAIPAIITAFILNKHGNPLPGYFSNVSAGLAYYSIGFYLRTRQYLIPVMIVSAVIYLLFVFWGVTEVDMRGNALIRGHYLLWFVFSTVGCITFNSLFEKMPWKFNILTFIGKNAMIIYVTHWMVISVYYYAIQPLHFNSTQRIIGLFSTMIIAEYLIIQLFRWPKMQMLLKPASMKKGS